MKHIKPQDDFRKEMDNLQQTRTELIERIKEDCAPFLELSKTCRYPLQFFRGTSTAVSYTHLTLPTKRIV